MGGAVGKGGVSNSASRGIKDTQIKHSIMKLKTTFFILLTAITVIAKAQYVTIPDTNFVAWLQEHYPNCLNGNQMDTICIGNLNIQRIDVSNQNIFDLAGIQHFVFLDSLLCNHNHISTLPILPVKLKYLECANNLLNSISFVTDSLRELICSDNQLTIISNLPDSLRTLSCEYNQLDSLPDLPVNLEYLRCDYNELVHLPAFPPGLRYLYCVQNQLVNLSSLPSGLLALECTSNQLASLPYLPSNLQYLWCANNLITVIPNLPDSLIGLNCSNNQITNLPSLPENLYFISCDNNQLTNISGFPSSLNYINCSNNQLTSIPNLPVDLAFLHCNNNNILCFPKFPNSLVDFINFNIHNNPFACLPNYISVMDATILAYPLCVTEDTISNPSGCPTAEGISGFTYLDDNEDCIKSNGEESIYNIPVKLFNSGNSQVAQTFSFINGVYYINASSGNYTVRLDTTNLPLPFSVNCNTDTAIILSNSVFLAQNVNFGIKCKPGHDVGVQSIVTSGWVFPGQQHTLKILAGDISHWYNLHCADGVSGQLQLSVSGPVTYSGVIPNALTPTITGNTFTYQIADFGTINNSDAFGLLFTTDTTAQAGDTICINATITSPGNDNNTSNNTYQFCYNVINSYDPNMKEVYPVNVFPGYQDWFTYTIHFQNTGSAPAFNIRLADTLDNNLDLETFQVINYSHYNTVSLQNNAISFRFPNIMLPDSASNPEGFKGFVQYRIKPKPNMSLGTQIHNTAYIYFDYNPAIITNTTINEFTQPSSINENELGQLKIYPNPGTGSYSVILPQKSKLQDIRLDVYNVFGEIVGNSESSGSVNSDKKILHININQQPNGIYFVKGEINGRFFYQRIVKQ